MRNVIVVTDQRSQNQSDQVIDAVRFVNVQHCLEQASLNPGSFINVTVSHIYKASPTHAKLTVMWGLQTTNQTNERTNERTNQPTNQPTNERANERTNQPTNQPTNERTNQPTNQRTNQPTNQPTNEPTKKQRNNV